MYWDAGAGSWIDGPGKDTNGQARQKPVTPASPDASPFDVTIWSTSETGLRSVGWRTDPRIQTIEVDLIDFIVEPDPGHVLIEQQLGFTAVDYDGRPVEVTWRATGGQIDQNGVYTAGKEPGTYTVRREPAGPDEAPIVVRRECSEAGCRPPRPGYSVCPGVLLILAEPEAGAPRCVVGWAHAEADLCFPPVHARRDRGGAVRRRVARRLWWIV